MSPFEFSRWRRRPAVIALTVLLALVWLYALAPRAPGLPPEVVLRDLEHLRKYANTSQFSYARRIIRTKLFTGDRKDLTTVDEPLFPAPQILDKDTLSRAQLVSLPPLELAVSRSPKVDTSILSFGIATSVSRLNEATPQLLHWLPHTGCPLHVIAPPADDTASTQFRMNELGLNTTIETSSVEFPVAYFSLLKRLYDTRSPRTKWIVLIDDDTFITSLPSLVSHLSTTYDSSKEVVVGATSDNFDQIRVWGVQPFGGGGIFISVPLAARLTSPDIWDKCVNGMGHNQGDKILSSCLNEFTDIRPKFDDGLNQMDITGENDPAAGYLESGRRMLTLHHWRSWFHVDIPTAALVSKACGDQGVFQRWAFPAANQVLSNGFSIVEYPKGLDTVNLASVEKTWDGDEQKFLHRIGPLRNPLGKEDKISYRLLDAEVVEGWFVRQIYARKAVQQEGSGDNEMDRILELIWLL